MGFGIAAGMLLFFLVVGVVVLVGIGLATHTLTWPFAGPAGQRFEGVGSTKSVAIALGGTYYIEWTAAPTSPAACPLNAALRSESASGFSAVLVSTVVPAATPPVGNSSEVTVTKGSYVLAVESSCSWTFRLVPAE